MALTDIVFLAGDEQDFILELPAGTLGTPKDIVFNSGTNNLPVEEIASVQISTGFVF